MNLFARVRLGELAAVIALIFFGLAGAIPGIAPNQANEMTGANATGLQTVAGIGSQMLIDALIALLLLRRWKVFQGTGARLIFPMLLPVWTAVSVLWSQDPVLTARRAVPFVLAAAFGMFLAIRYDQRRFLFLLQAAFAVLACWSAVLALGFPAIGLDASTGHGGDWQGVFTQKNACGRAMVFALSAVLASGRLSPARAALFLLFTAELALSRSRGAWVLGLVLAAVLWSFRLSCRFDKHTRTAMLMGGGVTAVGFAALAQAAFATVAPMLGRDATLTGRTAIWHEVWLSILHRPWLGYGFSAFWRGAQGASWSVVVALKFVLFHAHNGFLEIWLELGAAGLGLFALGLLRAALLLWPELRAGRYQEAAWPLSTLLLIVLYDFDENTLLSFNGLFWVLYMVAVTRVEVLAAERRVVGRALLRQPTLEAGPWAPHFVFLPKMPAFQPMVQAAQENKQTASGVRSAWL